MKTLYIILCLCLSACEPPPARPTFNIGQIVEIRLTHEQVSVVRMNYTFQNAGMWEVRRKDNTTLLVAPEELQTLPEVMKIELN